MFFVSNLIKKSNVLGVHKLSLEGWRVLRTSKKNKKALCCSLVGSPGWLRARCWVTGLVLLALAVSVALLICHGPWGLHHQAHNGRDYSRDYGYDDIELVKEQRLRLLVHGNIFFLQDFYFYWFCQYSGKILLSVSERLYTHSVPFLQAIVWLVCLHAGQSQATITLSSSSGLTSQKLELHDSALTKAFTRHFKSRIIVIVWLKSNIKGALSQHSDFAIPHCKYFEET